MAMKIFLTGIAGAGMHSLALYLSDAGYDISGSDPWIDETRLKFWADRGVVVYREQKEENIDGVDMVIYSAAVPPSNPERRAADDRHIGYSRGEALARFTNEHGGCIAVCGTHGKGTTSGAILKGLNDAGIVVSDILGAVPIGFTQPSICRRGSKYLVCEVDESDRTNLFHRPAWLLINNIEEDHLNVYRDLDDIIDTFAKHVRLCLEYGTKVVIHYAGVGAPGLYERLKDCREIFWVCEEGKLESPALAWKIESPDAHGCCRLHIRQANGETYSILPRLGGRANAQNLASAACLLGQTGIPTSVIADSLTGYKGLKDRCQVQRNGQKMLVTDYASHPTCVANDIEWVRPIAGRIIAVYHPYRYSLMKCHWQELAKNLAQADVVLLAPFDGAGETPVEGLDSYDLARRIRQHGTACEAQAFESFEDLESAAFQMVVDGDCLMIFGGGPLFRMGRRIVFSE